MSDSYPSSSIPTPVFVHEDMSQGPPALDPYASGSQQDKGWRNSAYASTQPYSLGGETVSVAQMPASNNSTVSGIIKLLLLLLLPLGITAAVGTVVVTQAQEVNYQKNKNILLSAPMKDVSWQDLGNVFEPTITLPVKSKTGYEDWEFLLDSGAVISSLPREWADKMGKDLAFMKRSTFKGFGGKTSFAYQDEMMVLLGNEEETLPVVFTEASNTKSLLGRKGFFENYSIYFNHLDKRIEIRK